MIAGPARDLVSEIEIMLRPGEGAGWQNRDNVTGGMIAIPEMIAGPARELVDKGDTMLLAE